MRGFVCDTPKGTVWIDSPFFFAKEPLINIIKSSFRICSIDLNVRDTEAFIFIILPMIGLYEKIFFSALSLVSLPFKVLIVVKILFFTFMRYSCK